MANSPVCVAKLAGVFFALNHDNFEPLGRWEVERGPQQFGYDFAWHLGYDIAVTSEWGTPNLVEGGVNAELLLAGKYGHRLHIWDLRKRRHLQALDLGPEQQWFWNCAQRTIQRRPTGLSVWSRR